MYKNIRNGCMINIPKLHKKKHLLGLSEVYQLSLSIQALDFDYILIYSLLSIISKTDNKMNGKL